jgi:hypothetical protein
MAPKLYDSKTRARVQVASLTLFYERNFHVFAKKITFEFQGYNGKALDALQQDKVCWQNHLLGGWTVQQWRSNIDDCTPTAVEFNLCPGDDEGCILTFELRLLF